MFCCQSTHHSEDGGAYIWEFGNNVQRRGFENLKMNWRVKIDGFTEIRDDTLLKPGLTQIDER